MSNIKRVVIAGGGTAGWMTAAALTKLLNCEVTLIESDDIPTVGVGEATIPPIITFHRLLNIDEKEFMRETQATFKLGISFENWKDRGESYFHSFGDTGKGCWAAGFHNFWLKGKKLGISEDYSQYSPETMAAYANKFAVMKNGELKYAYHLDAGLYAKFLRKIAERHGATRLEGRIERVKLNHDSGDIDALLLSDGTKVEGDLFIDCTGFRALLIEGALHSGFDDWSHWLPSDSAIAMQTSPTEEAIPYTRSIASDYGWQWRIPLQHRVGNGLVYCSRYGSEQEAIDTLVNNVSGKPLNDPRVIRYTTGQRRNHWVKNCVAIGLSSGFIEPLESTSIHLIQKSIVWLMTLFPKDSINKADVAQYNSQLRTETNFIRDFIILHYHVTQREDTRFWRFCKNMELPDTLRQRIALFEESGRFVTIPDDLFAENSWVQVMLGQGLNPADYHKIVDMMSEEELRGFLNGQRASVAKLASSLPAHAEFVSRYCGSGAAMG